MVTDQNGRQLRWLKELEIIQIPIAQDFIFANQYGTNLIFMIRISDGLVIKRWNMEEIYLRQYMKHWNKNKYGPWTPSLEQPPHGWSHAVLNGITYLSDRDSFLLTGRDWDTIFEVKLDYAYHMI